MKRKENEIPIFGRSFLKDQTSIKRASTFALRNNFRFKSELERAYERTCKSERLGKLDSHVRLGQECLKFTIFETKWAIRLADMTFRTKLADEFID